MSESITRLTHPVSPVELVPRHVLELLVDLVVPGLGPGSQVVSTSLPVAVAALWTARLPTLVLLLVQGLQDKEHFFFTLLQYVHICSKKK